MNNNKFTFSVVYHERRNMHSWLFCTQHKHLENQQRLEKAHLASADMLIARKPHLIIPLQTRPLTGEIGEGGFYLLAKDIIEMPAYFMTDSLFWERCVPGDNFHEKLHFLSTIEYESATTPAGQESKGSQSLAKTLNEWSQEHGLLCIAVP